MEEETTKAMAWITFPNFLSTYYAELFSSASTVCTLYLGMVTINKTSPRCAKVMVLVDLFTNLPNHVRMDIRDEKTGATSSVKSKY